MSYKLKICTCSIRVLDIRHYGCLLFAGIIYTMVAFGPVLGFLLGAYLISYYVDALFVDTSVMQASELGLGSV